MSDIDMRLFAKSAGANVSFPAGSIVFNRGDAGGCMYVVQSGVVEIAIGDKVVEVCGPNEAIGFMSIIDGSTRTSTARVKETAELSIIDQRKFRFMVDEVPAYAASGKGEHRSWQRARTSFWESAMVDAVTGPAAVWEDGVEHGSGGAPRPAPRADRRLGSRCLIRAPQRDNDLAARLGLPIRATVAHAQPSSAHVNRYTHANANLSP